MTVVQTHTKWNKGATARIKTNCLHQE